MCLKIDNLSKRFDEKILFDGFSASFPSVGIICLVGESGVGKTTLLRMISGLDTDYSGEISGAGIGNVSYAFQEPRLFPTVSTLDNLILAVFGKKSAEGEKVALSMLSSLGINEKDSELLPSELSGGMKQRVSLARAFLKDAPILLLDEPTKELDEENVGLVIDEIRRQSEKRLVIMVTHRQEDVKSLGCQILKL